VAHRDPIQVPDSVDESVAYQPNIQLIACACDRPFGQLLKAKNNHEANPKQMQAE
jgi:hypothetical protein